MYGEIKDIGKRTSNAGDFAIRKEVSESVFTLLAYSSRNGKYHPDVPENIQGKKYSFSNNLQEYFGHDEESPEQIRKLDYCDALQKTSTFSGRKLLFEEIFPSLSEYTIFQHISYTTKIDEIIRSIVQESSLYLHQFFDISSHTCYTKGEIILYFEMLYQLLWEKETNIESAMEQTEEIIRGSRTGRKAVDTKEAKNILKNIEMLKLLKLSISLNSLEKYRGLYTYIPSIVSSTHGEKSTVIELLKSFIKTQYPKKIQKTKKDIRVFDTVLLDAENIAWFKKQKTKFNIWKNKLLKGARVDKIIDFGNALRNSFAEKKMDLFLMYNRKSYPELREDISPELHKECMKQYFLIQKLFQNIELNVGIDESGEALQKPKSRILRFLIGRGKSKGVGPIASRMWFLFGKIGGIMKAIPLLPTTLIKTTFIFIAYKVIYALLDILGHIPLLKNFGKMIEIQGMHSISPSPELQDFLIGNIDKLEHINTQINIIRKLERLHVIQQDLDTKAYEIHSDGYFHRNIPEEIELQRTLLEAEKKSLQEELEQEKLEQEIILLKRRFLSLLDALGENSKKSLIE